MTNEVQQVVTRREPLSSDPPQHVFRHIDRPATDKLDVLTKRFDVDARLSASHAMPTKFASDLELLEQPSRAYRDQISEHKGE